MSENDYNEFDEQENQLPERTRRLKSGIKFTRVLLLLIMAVTAIVLLFANKDKLSADNFKRLAAKIDLGVSTNSDVDSAVIDFDYNSTSKVKTYKDGIARVTDDNLVIMDNIGTQFQSVLTGFNSPQILTSARYVCVFDRGGRRLMVCDSFTVLFDHAFDDNIVDVSMNNNGYIAVITESESYKNHCIVFDSSFKEIYKINSLSRYFVTADISPDNKRIVLSSLYAKDSDVIPQINCYRLDKKDPVWSVDYTDSVAVDVNIKSDGKTALLFEWGIAVLNENGKEKYRHQFGDDILQNYHMSDGKYNVTVVSASQSGFSTITVFDNNGKQISDIQFDSAVFSVDQTGDRLAVLTADTVYLYDIKGKLISQRENSADGTAVLFSGKNSLVTVSPARAVYNKMN